MTEPDPSYVQLPDDATPANKNKIRSYSVIDDEGVTVLQQVSVIADEYGRIVDFTALQDSITALSEQIEQLRETLLVVFA